MAKRKNKLVQVREPNGRPSRAAQVREFPPAQVRRLRDAAMVGLRDPQWGTELGRLYLNGSISEEMYAAGKWWREMAARYHAAICIPADAKSAGFDVGRGQQAAHPDSDSGKREAERHKRAVANFHEARTVLHGAGLGVENAIRCLCEDDRVLAGYGELHMAKAGLLLIADHRGLTNRRKSLVVR